MKMRACIMTVSGLLLLAATGCPMAPSGNGNTNTNTNTNNNTAITGDATAGATFFSDNNCATCHGADGSGGIGPDIRMEDADEIFSRLSGGTSHPGGTVNGVTQQDAADVEAWLITQQ